MLEKILKEFDSGIHLYMDFNLKLRFIIIELLKNHGIKYHQITDRVKDRVRLKEKIIRKRKKYKHLKDITDISGIRIITYYEDEVDQISEIIQNEFLIDKENSVDKREIEADKFGYRSLHFVISLSKDRLKLSEYSKFRWLKAEIQIRSILQHSWAEIEHDIGYKGEISIPKFAQRSFFRIAALLETADLEFVNLKKILTKYEKTVPNSIDEAPDHVLIDKASLSSYIKRNPVVNDLDIKMAEYLKVPLEFDDGTIEKLLELLQELEISTIKELDEIVTNNSEKLLDIFKEQSTRDIGNVAECLSGISLFQLKHIMK